MKVYVFGEENEKTLLMFQCTAEPWWVFKNSAEALSKDFRVFLFISDGHDELGTDFVSIEKNVEQAVSYLHGNGIRYLDMVYGVSMGGASVMYMLAHELMPVKKAVIDAGITPYPYPKWLCRIIAIKDFLMLKTAFRSLKIMKLAMPPERWTPKGKTLRNITEKSLILGKITIPTRQSTMCSGLPTTIPCPNLSPHRIRRWNIGMAKRKKQQEKATLHTQRRLFLKSSSKNLRA